MSEADAYRRAAEAIEEAEMWRNIALLMPWAQSWRMPPFENQAERGLKPLPREWYEQNRWYREQQEKRQREARPAIADQPLWQLKQQVAEQRRRAAREAKLPMYPASGPRPPAA